MLATFDLRSNLWCFVSWKSECERWECWQGPRGEIDAEWSQVELSEMKIALLRRFLHGLHGKRIDLVKSEVGWGTRCNRLPAVRLLRGRGRETPPSLSMDQRARDDVDPAPEPQIVVKSTLSGAYVPLTDRKRTRSRVGRAVAWPAFQPKRPKAPLLCWIACPAQPDSCFLLGRAHRFFFDRILGPDTLLGMLLFEV